MHTRVTYASKKQALTALSTIFSQSTRRSAIYKTAHAVTMPIITLSLKDNNRSYVLTATKVTIPSGTARTAMSFCARTAVWHIPVSKSPKTMSSPRTISLSMRTTPTVTAVISTYEPSTIAPFIQKRSCHSSVRRVTR